MDKKITLADIIPYIKSSGKEGLIKFIKTDDSSTVPLLPKAIANEIRNNDDLKTDVYWYLEINESIDIDNFPCIHLAYANSNKLNNIINKEGDLYILRYGTLSSDRIVIGHCPWCGKKLNTSLQSDSSA